MTRRTLYAGDYSSVRECIEAAVACGVDLCGANLRGVDLRGAALSWAKLQRANLRDADLRGADLHWADMRDADLRGADLHWADMRDADLRGAGLRDADFRDATFNRADLRGAHLPDDIPIVPHLDAAILAACEDGRLLNMARWHCGSAHCRAGWAIVLAGDAGKRLERRFGTNAAAALIYAASTPGGCIVPDWHASRADALDDLRRWARASAPGVMP